MGAAGAGGGEKIYVEDVFSTYLYTGNNSTQTITNGIDLAGKGGLVWIKGRSGATGHRLTDTARGATKSLESNSTTAEVTESTGLTSFSSTGFALGADADYSTNAATYASWTFRKAPKFFDVVTYTGNGSARTIAHNLGSVPGCIIVKRTDSGDNWQVYHRSLANTEYIELNSTAAKATGTTRWNSTTPTSTVFSLGTDATVNASGGTYVAYLFAHDAGGFGNAGTDSVVKCGSYTGTGSPGLAVTLGFEPQWVMVKNASSGSYMGWLMFDNMRGMAVGDGDWYFYPHSSVGEQGATSNYINPTATGFTLNNASQVINESGNTFIYIAIRRGPMKTPTDATKVFSPLTLNGTTGTKLTTGFPVDMQISAVRTFTDSTSNNVVNDRMRGVSANTTGVSKKLNTATNQAESTPGTGSLFWDNTGFQFPFFINGYSSIFYNFRRAPGFFDVVAYTGTGSATTVSHNLSVAPELMIIKKRSAANAWIVYANNDNTDYLKLMESAATVDDNTIWNDTSPTSSVFTVGTNDDVNGNTATFIAYLFASCPSVSKVGSYTGTGTTLQINCGFTAGARFVLIKRTDSTGDWYTWDTARGIISGNDPYLLLNSTATEVTNTDYIDPYTAGFEISSTAPAAINANGGSFIFLAIA